MKAKRVGQTTVEEGGPGVGERTEALLAMCGERPGDGLVLVVQREGQLLGAWVVRLHAPDAEIVALVTRPNHRHRGFGRLLIREMARRARIAACSRLRLHLPRRDDAPRSFFARLGVEDTHLAFDLRL